MRCRFPLLVALSLITAAATAQHSTTNGGSPSDFTSTPSRPTGPGSFTANPWSPPPTRPDALVARPKPRKPEVPDERVPTDAGSSSEPAKRTPNPPVASDEVATARPAPANGSEALPAPVDDGPVVPDTGVSGTLVRSLEENSGFEPLPNDASDIDEAEFEPGQVLIQTTDMTTARDIQNALAPLGYRVRARRNHRALGFVVMNLRTPDDQPVGTAVVDLRARFPEVIVEANHRYRPLSTADRRQYGQRIIGWQQIPACASQLRIGMIDTPVSASHAALKGARLHNQSVLPAGVEAADANHGTAVASLLVGNGEEGIAGLLPGAELHAVGAFRASGEKRMDTNVELLLLAFDQLLGASVSVLNLSFGGPENRLLEVAIRRFVESGIPVVAAAGNDRRRGQVYPAAYAPVVAVTALDAERRIMKGASRGTYIDIAAPGVDVWAARAAGGGKYYSGTSFATPFVTAMIAVLHHDMAKASGAFEASVEALTSLASDLGDEGTDPVYGAGLVQWSPRC